MNNLRTAGISTVVAALAVTLAAGCNDGAPSAPPPSLGTPSVISAPHAALNAGVEQGALTLQVMRNRNPMRWVGDSVQSAMRGFRAQYVARSKSGLPKANLCEGVTEYVFEQHFLGRGLSTEEKAQIQDRVRRLKGCNGLRPRARFFQTSAMRLALPIEDTLTAAGVALLDSLNLIADRAVQNAGSYSMATNKALMLSEIANIESLSSTLSPGEYEFVNAAISGMLATMDDAESQTPTILAEAEQAIDECAERLDGEPLSVEACEEEVGEYIETMGRTAEPIRRRVLMCAIALNASPALQQQENPCKGETIMPNMAKGFIGGFVGGFAVGVLTGPGALASATLGGLGGAIGGLAVGLAEAFWCEISRR